MDTAYTLVSLLRTLHMTLTSAESCTGGLIGKRITDIPGASTVFPGGIISYCDRVKADVLGVNPETLQNETAVSAACAAEMAQGAMRLMHTDFALSVTGYAGPCDPEEENDQTGLVYIGLAYGEHTSVKECHFDGDRAQVRALAAETALSMLLSLLTPLAKEGV